MSIAGTLGDVVMDSMPGDGSEGHPEPALSDSLVIWSMVVGCQHPHLPSESLHWVPGSWEAAGLLHVDSLPSTWEIWMESLALASAVWGSLGAACMLSLSDLRVWWLWPAGLALPSSPHPPSLSGLDVPSLPRDL